MQLALLIVAAILAVVILVRGRAADLAGWAILAMSIALLWGRVHL